MNNFRTRITEFNTSRLNDLAASLSQCFSVNGTTGITISSMNINSINSSTINSSTIKLSSNSSTGYVLTCVDSSGTAQWQSESKVITFTGVTFSSSIWTFPEFQTLRFTKNGKLVNVFIQSISDISNTNNFIQTNPVILPSEFAMSSLQHGIYSTIPIVNNGQFTLGQLQLNYNFNPTGAQIYFYIFTATGSNFGGSGYCGYPNISIDYITDK